MGKYSMQYDRRWARDTDLSEPVPGKISLFLEETVSSLFAPTGAASCLGTQIREGCKNYQQQHREK